MDFNKIKEMGLEYAEKGKNAALDLAEKGRTQAKIVNAQGKLYRAQRQLGALVYSLAKGNEENQPLVDKYIEMIANIEQELANLKASLEPDAIIETTFEEKDPQRLPRKSPRPTRPRPAPSAAHPSRTMRCSATSAAHSCNRPAQGGVPRGDAAFCCE